MSKKFVKCAENFLAKNFPSLHKKLWQIYKGVKYTDCGKFFLVEMKNSSAFLRPKKEFDFSLALPLDFKTDFSEKKSGRCYSHFLS